MRWLIWKEFRLHWLILLIATFLLLMPYVMQLTTSIGDTSGFGRNAFPIALNIVFAYFTMALLGGHAIACERADRSSEFLFCAPVSRRTIVLSKLFLPAVTVVVVGVVNLSTLATNTSIMHKTDFLCFAALWALAGFFAFSVAWLVSALQNSPTFAIGAGLAVPWATAALCVSGGWLIGYDRIPEWLGMAIFAGLAFVSGAASFVGGTWYYLRRVEP